MLFTVLSNYRISFLIDNKDIELYREKKKEKKIDSLLLFSLIAAAKFIERLLLIVSFVNLEFTKENLCFLNILFISL